MMAGPWEDYSLSQSKPWEDYAVASAVSGEPATFTKLAEPYDPSFSGTLGREFYGGISDIGAGVRGALSLPKSGENLPGQPITGLIQAIFGAGRAITSPIAAAGAVVGEQTGEPIRTVTEPFLGPTGSAIAGTAVGAPLNVATQIVGAPALAAKLGPYGMRVVQGIARRLPDAQVTLREIGKKIVQALPDTMRPPISSEVLFEEVRQLNPKTTLPLFEKIAKKITARESKLEEFGLASRPLESTAGKSASALRESVEPAAKWLGDQFGIDPTIRLKKLPFKTIMEIRQRLGEHISSLRQSGGIELGSFKRMFRAVSEDLENSANQGVGAAFNKLKEANIASNREFALGELDDIFNATMGKAREGAEFTSSNFASALNKIRDLTRIDKVTGKPVDELFTKGIGAANLRKIESHLEELHKLKVLPPPKGVNVGSRTANLMMGGGGGLGFAIGTWVGGPQVGAIAGGLSTAGMAIGPRAIARIVRSDAGSRALVNLLKKDGEVSAVNIAAILSLVRGEEAIRNDIAGQLKESLISADIPIDQKIQAAMTKDNIFKSADRAEVMLNQ